MFSEYIYQIKDAKRNKSELKSQMQEETTPHGSGKHYGMGTHNVGDQQEIKVEEEMKNDTKIEDIQDMMQPPFNHYGQGIMGNQMQQQMENELEDEQYDQMNFGTNYYYGSFN